MEISNTASFVLFYTDIEGSTQIAKSLGQDYAVILDKHNEIIVSGVKKHGGKIIDQTGDGFFIIFENPVEALKAAASIQMEFQDISWSFSVDLKVRIALHIGQIYPVGNLYTGIEIHRASRICSACHGGQILISGKLKAKLEEKLPEHLSLKGLGNYRLRDFDEPVELYQLIVKGLISKFGKPNTDAEIPVVGVLPIVNRSKDPELDYFSDGITEDLIISIGKIRGIRVLSRATAFSFKGKDENPVEIGKQLGASVILDGSMRLLGDQISINIELVKVEDGISLWSSKYEKEKKEILAIQDDIAANVIETLGIKIGEKKPAKIQSPHTSKIEAYEYYLQGRKYYDLYSLKSIKYAIEMFQKAIDIDYKYALAYCGLADCYSYLYMYHEATEDNLQLAQMTSRNAVKLNPSLAEAFVSRGMVLSLSKKYEESEEAFKKAVELGPTLFEAYYQYGRMSLVTGKIDQAARLMISANSVRKEDYQSLCLAGQYYEDLGDLVKSIEIRQRGVMIAEKHLKINPGDTRALYMGANSLIALGERERGLDWLNRALTLDPDDAMLLYNAGCIYSMCDMPDEALNCLEKSANSGLTQKDWYIHDSDLDPLREMDRFKNILAKMK
jgi:TolB-like protein/Flp pilus assembly protein TadD